MKSQWSAMYWRQGASNLETWYSFEKKATFQVRGMSFYLVICWEIQNTRVISKIKPRSPARRNSADTFHLLIKGNYSKYQCWLWSMFMIISSIFLQFFLFKINFYKYYFNIILNKTIFLKINTDPLHHRS